jgi:hypothetical protein
MKIECMSNSATTLSEELIRPELGLGRDRVFSLKVGKQYVVYGLTFNLGNVWYYICDEDYTYYPIWNPSPLFRIVDGRVSSFWRLGLYSVGSSRLAMAIMSFEEWVNDPLFYDKLTDGDEIAVAVFRRYKQLLDVEAERS